MNIFNRFYEKFFHSRDKPQNALMGSMQYFFGRRRADRERTHGHAGHGGVRLRPYPGRKSIAGLPLHVYRYKDQGKEMVPNHPLYPLLHDEPNPEMTSFIFRETLMQTMEDAVAKLKR